jgi:hypothetical protein
MESSDTSPKPESLVDFSLALEARVQWALATYACDPATTGEYAEYGAKMERAEELASEAGWSCPGAPVPHLFADVPYLRDIFVNAAEVALDLRAEIEAEVEEERRETELEAERLRELNRINALLQADDWPALDLPMPEALLATLAAGESADINGHSVSYDSDDEMTWYTNPYGIDGVLSNGLPTVRRVRRFLADMALGVEYGPTPD